MSSVWNTINFMLLSVAIGGAARTWNDFLGDWKDGTDRIDNLETRVGVIETRVATSKTHFGIHEP